MFLLKENSIFIRLVNLGKMSKRLIFHVSLKTWNDRSFVESLIKVILVSCQ